MSFLVGHLRHLRKLAHRRCGLETFVLSLSSGMMPLEDLVLDCFGNFECLEDFVADVCQQSEEFLCQIGHELAGQPFD